MTGAMTTLTAHRLTLPPEARAAVDRHGAAGGGLLNSGCIRDNTASRRIPQTLGLRPGPREVEWANSHGREVEVQRMILSP
jgi:hypothetical protein